MGSDAGEGSELMIQLLRAELGDRRDFAANVLAKRYSALIEDGLLRNALLLEYCCRNKRSCVLLRAYAVKDASGNPTVALHLPKYGLAPGLNQATSNAAGRARMIDGKWPARDLLLLDLVDVIHDEEAGTSRIVDLSAAAVVAPDGTITNGSVTAPLALSCAHLAHHTVLGTELVKLIDGRQPGQAPTIRLPR